MNEGMSEGLMSEVAIKIADVFEILSDVSTDDLKEIKRLSQQTVGLRDTSKFNIGVRMLRRKEIREQHARLMAAIAAEKYVEGFVMAMQLMAAFGA